MALRSSPHLAPETVMRSRDLRAHATDAERALWLALRETLAGARFRRQVPLGPYFADFASHPARLVIELDGGQHGDAAGYDAARTRFLEGEGYKVLRFWNNEVLENLDGVLATIAAACPSPLVGEGGPQGRIGGARPRRAPASGRHPSPRPSPTRGEGENAGGARRRRAPT